MRHFVNETPRFDWRVTFFLFSSAIFEMMPVIAWCMALMPSIFALYGTLNPLSVWVDTDSVNLPPGLAAHARSLPARLLLQKVSVLLACRCGRGSGVVALHGMDVFFLASPLPMLSEAGQKHTLRRSRRSQVGR